MNMGTPMTTIQPQSGAGAGTSTGGITVRRIAKVFRQNRTKTVIVIPHDIAELLHFQAGDSLMITANVEGGWFRAEKADTVTG